MAAIDDLKAKLVLAAEDVSDEIRKARLLVEIDRYINGLTQQSLLEANQISSYSIGGISVSRRNAAEGQAVIDALETRITRAIYGSTTLLDAGSSGL